MDYRNIEKDTLDNKNYRKVIHTTSNMQLVLMCLQPGENIPMEVHKKTSQFIRVESGRGIAIVGKNKVLLEDGVSIIIPPGTNHYVENIDSSALKLYTIYTPPEHSKNKIDKRQPKNINV